MQNNENGANIDPWAKMGNMGPKKSGNEISEEGLRQQAKWENAMADAPAFAGETNEVETSDIQTTEIEVSSIETDKKYDEKIADAGRILKYIDEAPYGLDHAMQIIEEFNSTEYDNPWLELKKQLGIMDEQYDSKKEERNDFRQSEGERKDLLQKSNLMASENVPNLDNSLSRQDFDYALKQVQELIGKIKLGKDPKYKNLNNEARNAGMGRFDYVIKDEKQKDVANLFSALNNREEKSDISEEIVKENSTQEDNEKKTDENPEQEQNEENDTTTALII